jgi:hypothetical protein
MTARQSQAVNAVAGHPEQIARVLYPSHELPPLRPVLAKITSSTAIGSTTNRWSYGWEEHWWDPSASPDTSALKTGGLDSIKAGVAYNVNEIGNTSTTACPGVTLANLPGTFAVKPISTDTRVVLFRFTADDGTAVWLFDKANAIDGECPE